MNNDLMLKRFLIVVALVIATLFGHLLLTSKIRILNKEAEILNTKLAHMQDELDSRIVLLQKLSSEERIVKIAKERLGLVRPTKMFKKIIVNENRIKRLEKIVNSKYE